MRVEIRAESQEGGAYLAHVTYQTDREVTSAPLRMGLEDLEALIATYEIASTLMPQVEVAVVVDEALRAVLSERPSGKHHKTCSAGCPRL
jgi:hypothetical protein